MMLTQAQELKWREVPEAAIKLAEEVKPKAEVLQAAIEDLPREGFLDLWYDTIKDKALINLGDWVTLEDANAWKDAVRPHVSDIETLDEAGDQSDRPGYVKIATRTLAALRFCEKRAADPYLKGLAQYLGYLPGKIPGGPNPLIATLSSGLLGAGLGYGGGKLVNWLVPETKKWNLTPRMAILGGMAGAAPGAAWMASNRSAGLPMLSGELMRGEEYVPDTPIHDSHRHLTDFTNKQSSFDAREHPDYSFDSREFNQSIWEDPRVASRLSGPTQAAASGLVTGAAHLSGGPRMVTPTDIGRVAAGMGSGYTSGAIVGKALGALLGMPQNMQDRLKQTGMWAGVIANIVPIAFGGR